MLGATSEESFKVIQQLMSVYRLKDSSVKNKKPLSDIVLPENSIGHLKRKQVAAAPRKPDLWSLAL